MTLLEAATAVVEARYFGKERSEINEAIEKIIRKVIAKLGGKEGA